MTEYYRAGLSLCVQRPSRCFWYLDAYTALCAKCLGLYVGMMIASLAIITRRFKISNINAWHFTAFVFFFMLIVLHSAIRSRWGGLIFPTGANFIFGLIGSICFTIAISYLTVTYKGIAMLFKGKLFLFIFCLIVALHIMGVHKALAASADTSQMVANENVSNEKIKSIQAEIESLKKEKQAQEIQNQINRLQMQLDSIKNTDQANEAMQRPLPDSAQGKPLMMPIRRVTVHAGTPIILQVETAFSSQDVKEGDSVALRVQRPVLVDGVVVVRQGVAALSVVTSCKAAKGWGAEGEMTLNIKSVPAVDGSQIMLNGAANRRGESNHGEATAVAVGTGVLCLPLALSGAAVTGEEGKFPVGYEIVAHVDGDHKVKLFSEEDQLKIYHEQKTAAQEAEQAFKKQIEENIKKREEAQKSSDNME